MDLHIDIDLREVPCGLERDPESGQITAFNDDLRVMAIGGDEAEAVARFQDALVQLAESEVEAGRPLPSGLSRYISIPA